MVDGPLKVVRNWLQLAVHFNVFLDFVEECINNFLVWWLLVEPEGQDLLENRPEVLGAPFDDLACVVHVDALFQKVFERTIHNAGENLFISPRQLVFVQQVNHDVHEGLHVVSPALADAGAAVETGEHKVTHEGVEELLLDMGSIWIKILC